MRAMTEPFVCSGAGLGALGDIVIEFNPGHKLI